MNYSAHLHWTPWLPPRNVQLLIREGEKQNCFALKVSDEDNDARLQVEHGLWRRRFGPFLLGSKLENINTRGLTLGDPQRHISNDPRGGPFRHRLIYSGAG